MAAWRVERATRELDTWTAQTWEHVSDAKVREHGRVEGALDAKLEQRSARLEMLQTVTKPSSDEQALTHGTSNHALLEQMHQGARTTDKLPQPLHLAAEQTKRDLAHAQQNELIQSLRLRELNTQYAKAKAQGASKTALARIEQQRVKARQLRAAAREFQRDAHAYQAAINQRTQQLQKANDEHGRAVSRAIAAARTLIERGVDVSKWASTIAYPTREEERAVALGGRQTTQELAAENHRDRTRREQAIRDRAQLGQFIAAQQPPEKTRSRTRTRNPRGRGRGR